jgi:AAA+ superfamily predicted ATPase
VTGPRGTGKSALVRGLALEGDLPVVWITPARLASEFSSRMAAGLSRYCDMALRLQPSIRTPLPYLAVVFALLRSFSFFVKC